MPVNEYAAPHCIHYMTSMTKLDVFIRSVSWRDCIQEIAFGQVLQVEVPTSTSIDGAGSQVVS